MGDASSASSGDVFPSATLIDFGVARHARLGADTEPASRWRHAPVPGARAADERHVARSVGETCDFVAKVDIFALGCTLFFLCVGKELFGATPGGKRRRARRARTKTKARAQATQDAVEAALEKAAGAGSPLDLGVEGGGWWFCGRLARGLRDVYSPAGRANAFAAAALERALGGAAARAEIESQETETELDVAMLASMAEFPGYEPRTPEGDCVCGARVRCAGACAGASAAAHGAGTSFVNRKVTPRQPPGFASLIGACLARDPEDRPSAAEALNWPGAWVELDDDAA